MPDFRIDVGFFGHIKTKKLRRRLGLDGVFALQMLWAYAAQHEHDGCKIYTAEDISLAVDWDGDDLAGVLAEVGYLDEIDGGYAIHEWETYQPDVMRRIKYGHNKERLYPPDWKYRRISVFERDKYECVYCGEKVGNPHVDHVFPRCRGGSDEIDNLVTACPRCNQSKSSKTLEEWRK